MKNKRLIIILICVIVAIFVDFISIGIIYAEVTNAGNISYIYNTNIFVPEFSYEIKGNTFNAVNTNEEIALKKYDVIIEANDEPFDGLNYSLASSLDDENNYHYVYKNISINDILTFKTGVTYKEDSIRILPIITSFNNEEIKYNNCYVSNELDFELVSFGKNANFSINALLKKRHYSNIVYLIDDITLSDDVDIKTATSLDCGKYNLTLDGSLKIFHNFGGEYYINGNIVNTNNFSLVAENAHYNFYGTLENASDANIVTNGSIYEGILTDAIDYVSSRIPLLIYSDSIELYKNFMMYDVTYTYQIAYGTSNNYQDVLGETNVIELLKREVESQDVKFRITASDGTNEETTIVQSIIVGTNDNSLLTALVHEINATYYQPCNSVELLSILSDVYSYGYNSSITLGVNEDSSIVDSRFKLNNNVLDENSITLTYEDNKFKYGEEEVTSLIIQKGLMKLNQQCKITLSIGGSSETIQLEMTGSTNEQIKDYLASRLDSFTSDKIYGLYSLRGDDLYRGSSKVFSVFEQIKDIQYKITKNGIDIEVSQYCNVEKNGTYDEYLTVKDQNADLDGVYLTYTITFPNNEELSFNIPLGKTTATDPSEENNFKSNNPFDDVFQTEDTNWLKGTTFDFRKMTEYSTKDYASIEIVSIDGSNYDGNEIERNITLNNQEHKFDISQIIKINNDEKYSSYIDKIGKKVYRVIDIDVDLDYVPTWNTSVVIKCTAYEEDQLIVEQDYTIIIPGIYKCYNDEMSKTTKTPFVFNDINTYNLTIELLKNTKYTIKYDSNTTFILSDAQECSMEFNYMLMPLDNMTANVKNVGLDLTGLEQLINVTNINLSGFKIKDISSYNYYEGTALTVMDLSNCGLTDDILFSNGSNKSNLYNIYLEKVYLSHNDITLTNNLVYRTCRNLDLSYQRDLTDISGLSSLNALEELNISNNHIYRFEPVKTISTLKMLYCYNNTITGMGSYGSEGKINLPVYVWMIRENKTLIYNQNESMYLKINDDGKANSISTLQSDACTYLNSFAMQTKLYSNDINYINSDIASINKGDSYVSYKKIGGGSNTGIDSSNVTNYYILENGTFKKATSYSISTIYYQRVEQTYEYTCKFSGVNSDDILNKMVLINEDFSVSPTINPSAVETKASYIISIIDNGTIIASREFECTLYCTYANGGN